MQCTQIRLLCKQSAAFFVRQESSRTDWRTEWTRISFSFSLLKNLHLTCARVLHILHMSLFGILHFTYIIIFDNVLVNSFQTIVNSVHFDCHLFYHPLCSLKVGYVFVWGRVFTCRKYTRYILLHFFLLNESSIHIAVWSIEWSIFIQFVTFKIISWLKLIDRFFRLSSCSYYIPLTKLAATHLPFQTLHYHSIAIHFQLVINNIELMIHKNNSDFQSILLAHMHWVFSIISIVVRFLDTLFIDRRILSNRERARKKNGKKAREEEGPLVGLFSCAFISCFPIHPLLLFFLKLTSPGLVDLLSFLLWVVLRLFVFEFIYIFWYFSYRPHLSWNRTADHLSSSQVHTSDKPRIRLKSINIIIITTIIIISNSAIHSFIWYAWIWRSRSVVSFNQIWFDTFQIWILFPITNAVIIIIITTTANIALVQNTFLILIFHLFMFYFIALILQFFLFTISQFTDNKMNALNERQQQLLYSADDSINELIYNLNEQLSFGNNSLTRTKPPPPSTGDRTHSPHSPSNNAMDTYKLMQQLIANGTLIKEAVRRLEFSRQTTNSS